MTQSKDAPAGSDPQDAEKKVDDERAATPADEASGDGGEAAGETKEDASPTDAEPAPSAPSRKPDPPQAGGRSGGALGALALLLALAALGLAAYPYWSERRPAADEQAPAFGADQGRALAERVEAVEAELADAASAARSARSAADDARTRIEPVNDRIEALGRAIDALEQDLDSLGDGQRALQESASAVAPLIERVGRLEGTQSSAEASLEARMSALEQRIEQRVESLQQRLGSLGADLEEAGQESARRLALIHARALLGQGRDRLELNGDVEAAQDAWRRALQAVQAPGNVPQATIDALDRLVEDANALTATPVAQRVRALDTLAGASVDWPAPQAPVDEPPASEAADEDAGWRERMASAMGRLVRVESIDDALPNRADVDRARERIHAALSAAAVAAAREDWATAGAMIERTRADVEAFLDTDQPVVRRALGRMGELADPPQAPDVPSAFGEARSALADALEPAR